MKERPILMSAPMARAILAGTKTQTRRVMARQKKYDFTDYTLFGQQGFNNSPWKAIEHAPDWPDGKDDQCFCPYASHQGDRLWVRETWGYFDPDGGGQKFDDGGPAAPFREEMLQEGNPRRDYWRRRVAYAATWQEPRYGAGPDAPARWRPSIHMPRWASRITLEVTTLRVERLHDISEADALAEGINELVPPANRGEGLTPGALCLAATMAVDAMPRLSRRTFLGGALAAALGFKASASRPWEVQPTPWTKAPTPQQVYALLWESINGPGSWDANPWVWAITFRRLTDAAVIVHKETQ